MYGKPGTKAEIAALRAAIGVCEVEGLPFAADLATLLEKLTAPFKPRDNGPDMTAIEAVLIKESDGAIIPVQTGPGWWSTLSRRCVDRGCTLDTAELIGRWLKRQPWARGMTVDRVAASWPSFAARAAQDLRNATETPSSVRCDFEP